MNHSSTDAPAEGVAPMQSNTWHSWDPTPWRHPWLTSANLRAARSHDERLFASLIDNPSLSGTGRYGFVGNLANNMTIRALPLRRRALQITLFLHPFDTFVMSQPGWELSDAILTSDERDAKALAAGGVYLPDVPDTVTLDMPQGGNEWIGEIARGTSRQDWPPSGVPSYLRQFDAVNWPDFLSYIPALNQLQSCAALFAAQTPYLAYLARRPYLAAQTGGDLWFDAARNDGLGTLQRRAYQHAAAILATNPWAYANARRYGFRHVIYLPLLIDVDAYSPGHTAERREWEARVGGDFFALVTARLDRRWKGSQIGLDGFVQFADRYPGARLAVIGWGDGTPEYAGELQRRGLQGRVVFLPVSGKRKLIEYLRAADCVIDQFVTGYYGATALEALSTGTPVVMRLERDQYDALCWTGAPPVLAAGEPNAVAAGLERLYASSDERQRLAVASRRWIQLNHSVEVWGSRYAAILAATAARMRPSFRSSPLAQPLTSDELEYHRAGLLQAPEFPRYEI